MNGIKGDKNMVCLNISCSSSGATTTPSPPPPLHGSTPCKRRRATLSLYAQKYTIVRNESRVLQVQEPISDTLADDESIYGGQ